jgi:hypothetical protein
MFGAQVTLIEPAEVITDAQLEEKADFVKVVAVDTPPAKKRARRLA